MRKVLLITGACLLLAGCKTTRYYEVMQTDSVSTAVRTDTVYKDRVVKEYSRQRHDTVRERYVVVKPSAYDAQTGRATGYDTIGDYRRELVYVEKDSYLKDSLAVYRARLDSIMQYAGRERSTEVVVKEKPSPWRRLKEQVQWSALAAAVVWALYIVIRKKGGKG